VSLTGASRRQQSLNNIIHWKYGGRFIVIGPNPVHRNTYDFAGSKAKIVSALNEIF